MKTKALADLVSSLAASTASRKDLERRLAQLALGVVLALQDGTLSLVQAQSDLLNLDTYTAARRHRLNRRLLEILEWGMELEDVAELAPQGLGESYSHMTALARQVIGDSLPKSRSSAKSHS
jgi:Protein of unknown function (DUF3969)